VRIGVTNAPAEPIRILLVDMPQQLRDILRRHLIAGDGFVVAGESLDTVGLVEKVGSARAGAVVFGTDSPDLPAVGRELLDSYPRLKLLAVSSDGRRAAIHWLGPQKKVLVHVSPTHIIEAIRDAIYEPSGAK
jgi:DNA-binding NarL/FixJ family response regulator